MSFVTKVLIVLALCGAGAGWYFFIHSAATTGKSGETPASTTGGKAPGSKGGANEPVIVPVSISHVQQRDVPIYLEGLGTVQAFQGVTIRSQIEGVIEKIDFTEGQEIKKGERLALIDARTYQAQLGQAIAKKAQDEAKTAQDRARVLQDRAKKLQDEALEKQAAAKKVTDQALQNQATAKKAQDNTNLANARVNLKRYEDSRKEDAVSDQVVTDQRALVNQLESLVNSDEAAIQSFAATVQGDEVGIQAVQATIQGDIAIIQSDEELVKGDEAAVVSDEAAIEYARTFVSYATITSPIDGRTGVRQVDAGNLVRTNDTNGIVVVTQLQPISVIFTLPQQNLQAINIARAKTKLKVLAVDSDKKEIDTGELLLVDNQIDPTTGTIKLKATFPNAKFQLWPGGFVNIRLRLETREGAILVSSPAVQQGPNGTYVFLVKPDSTVEMRPVKVALIQDGKAILDEGLAKGDEVVLSGQDRLKNGSQVAVDRAKVDKAKADKAKAEASNGGKPADENGPVLDEANAAPKGGVGAATPGASK